MPGVISLENAREVFPSEVSVLQAALKGENFPTIDYFSHKCCNCPAGGGDESSTSLPLMAVYNLKSAELFKLLHDHEVSFGVYRDKAIHELNLDGLCDVSCLKIWFNDAAFLDELRRIAPFEG